MMRVRYRPELLSKSGPQREAHEGERIESWFKKIIFILGSDGVWE
jgi:hypothetical protein